MAKLPNRDQVGCQSSLGEDQNPGIQGSAGARLASMLSRRPRTPLGFLNFSLRELEGCTSSLSMFPEQFWSKTTYFPEAALPASQCSTWLLVRNQISTLKVPLTASQGSDRFLAEIPTSSRKAC